jgi:hypothetical protein
MGQVSKSQEVSHYKADLDKLRRDIAAALNLPLPTGDNSAGLHGVGGKAPKPYGAKIFQSLKGA